MPTLKPCPFGCPAEPRVVDLNKDVLVLCDDCGTTSFACNYGERKATDEGHYATAAVARSEAIELWNHRPAEERQANRVRELEQELAGLRAPT